MRHLTIGELAKHTQVSKVALRYYERAGLFPSVTRLHSGYRVYSENIVERIQFIKNAKSVGYSLIEIQGLLDLQENKTVKCEKLRDLVLKKQNAIHEKILALQKIEQTLQHFIATCEGQDLINKCTI
ncbi:MAG: MerR family transcriptional regulator [Gammaproteobacteria bacterium]|nr:MerR family transcriptional regulator [Gammaproteobacteria bacterium]